MSKQNLEIVRSIWEAAERRDRDAVFGFYDPAIVWDASTVPGPIAGVYHGHDGVRQYMRDWVEAFETHRVNAETFLAAGDRVVVGVRARGRGRASGVEVDMPRWLVYELRDGVVVRIDVFETKAQAFTAAGLRERESTS